MKIIKILAQVVTVSLSALAGNWIGGQVRSEQSGEPVNTLICEFVYDGRRYRNFPSFTRFYPAILFSSLSKPRWFWALTGGFLAGWLVDERYEQVLLNRIFKALDK